MTFIVASSITGRITIVTSPSGDVAWLTSVTAGGTFNH